MRKRTKKPAQNDQRQKHRQVGKGRSENPAVSLSEREKNSCTLTMSGMIPKSNEPMPKRKPDKPKRYGRKEASTRSSVEARMCLNILFPLESIAESILNPPAR
ncbi:hypothetical protein [Chlorobaculum tepidum]|uniref:hypothetical protein n=1 Tax=Chlorobaculum tepidum TaxID=1097 RepID=UPI0003119380|nr:hypothetical protein [Chlorobaculum tepidum]